MEDNVAYDLYNKLLQQTGNKIASQGWSNNEVSLLHWSIQRYCKNKGITQHDLNPKNWATISGFVPGRSDKDCEAKFNQGLFLNADEADLVVHQNKGAGTGQVSDQNYLINELEAH